VPEDSEMTPNVRKEIEDQDADSHVRSDSEKDTDRKVPQKGH